MIKRLLATLFPIVFMPYMIFAISLGTIQNNPSQYKKVFENAAWTVYVDTNSIEPLRYSPPYYTLKSKLYTVFYSGNNILDYTIAIDYDYNYSLESMIKKSSKIILITQAKSKISFFCKVHLKILEWLMLQTKYMLGLWMVQTLEDFFLLPGQSVSPAVYSMKPDFICFPNITIDHLEYPLRNRFLYQKQDRYFICPVFSFTNSGIWQEDHRVRRTNLQGPSYFSRLKDLLLPCLYQFPSLQEA